MDPIWMMEMKEKKNEVNQCGDYLWLKMVVNYIFKALKFVMAYQYAERFIPSGIFFNCMEMTAKSLVQLFKQKAIFSLMGVV